MGVPLVFFQVSFFFAAGEDFHLSFFLSLWCLSLFSPHSLSIPVSLLIHISSLFIPFLSPDMMVIKYATQFTILAFQE